MSLIKKEIEEEKIIIRFCHKCGCGAFDHYCFPYKFSEMPDKCREELKDEKIY